MSQVKNFPMVDKRVIELSADIEDYIREKSEGMPLVVVIGILEATKHLFMAESLVEMND